MEKVSPGEAKLDKDRPRHCGGSSREMLLLPPHWRRSWSSSPSAKLSLPRPRLHPRRYHTSSQLLLDVPPDNQLVSTSHVLTGIRCPAVPADQLFGYGC